MIRACEAANADPDVLNIEQEWDALADQADHISEPWNDAPARWGLVGTARSGIRIRDCKNETLSRPFEQYRKPAAQDSGRGAVVQFTLKTAVKTPRIRQLAGS